METSVSDEWKRPVNGMSGEMPNVHSCEGGRGASCYPTIAYSRIRGAATRAARFFRGFARINELITMVDPRRCLG